jgi:glyoxylase-like metal-dependent hydrolase (beta-lactamase superfamily II)
MRTTQIDAELIQLTRLHFVNAYLVREDDGFTLVDTTVGGGAGKLIAAAAANGGEIRRIVLTHGHGDHVGSLDALKQRLGVEVTMPTIDARIHAGEREEFGKLPGSWPKIATRPDVRVSGGERIGSLEVIASPGHSPGHVSYLDTRTRALIAGDAFTSYGAVAVPTHLYWRFPLAAMATWNRDTAIASARALRQLDPSVLVAGHGPAVRTPAAAMDRAIERASR